MSVAGPGIDLAKHGFQPHGVDAYGRAIVSWALRCGSSCRFATNCKTDIRSELEHAGPARRSTRALPPLSHDRPQPYLPTTADGGGHQICNWLQKYGARYGEHVAMTDLVAPCRCCNAVRAGKAWRAHPTMGLNSVSPLGHVNLAPPGIACAPIRAAREETGGGRRGLAARAGAGALRAGVPRRRDHARG